MSEKVWILYYPHVLEDKVWKGPEDPFWWGGENITVAKLFAVFLVRLATIITFLVSPKTLGAKQR